MAHSVRDIDSIPDHALRTTIWAEAMFCVATVLDSEETFIIIILNKSIPDYA